MEQRRDLRVKDETTLSITYSSSVGERRNLQVLSKDISTGGLQVRTPDFVAVGTRLNLQVVLRNPQRLIELLGVVRWIREASGVAMYEVGIQFENAPADALAALAQYVTGKSSARSTT